MQTLTWTYVDSTITVLSQNGTINLENHEIRLLYSRRENDRIVARIVSEKEGIVKAQIAPRADGKDQVEAFKALRKHVELCLERILRDVPGASMPYRDDLENGVMAGPSRSPHVSPVASPIQQSPIMATQRIEQSASPGRNGVPMDAPPAYGKAVKEWRSGDEEKKS